MQNVQITPLGSPYLPPPVFSLSLLSGGRPGGGAKSKKMTDRREATARPPRGEILTARVGAKPPTNHSEFRSEGSGLRVEEERGEAGFGSGFKKPAQGSGLRKKEGTQGVFCWRLGAFLVGDSGHFSVGNRGVFR